MTKSPSIDSNDSPENTTRDLRRRAEERLKNQKSEIRGQESEADAQQNLHELQVHQIELEMQNEELRAAHAETEEAVALYTDLYDFAPAGYFTLDRQGEILQSNLAGAALLQSERANLQGKRFETFVPPADRPAFSSFLKQVFSKQPDSTHEVRLEGKNGQAIVVQINASLPPDGQECRAVAIDITERKQAGERQEREAALLNETQQLTHVGGWQWNKEQQTMTWTDELYRIHGFSSDEFVTGTPEHIDRSIECYAPKDRPTIKAAFARCMAEGTPFDLEFPFTAADGVQKWIRTIGRAVWEKDRIVRVFGNVLDITQRKQTEMTLIQSSKLLEASQSIARVGGWELDIVTNDLYWTAETYRIHDTSPEEFTPTVDAGVGYFLPESGRIISEALKAAIEHGEGYDLELETLTTKGRRIDIRTSCEVMLHEGRPVKLTGIFQDITERKHTEKTLKEHNRDLERFNKMAVGRELRMIELKKEVNALDRELGRNEPYMG